MLLSPSSSPQIPLRSARWMLAGLLCLPDLLKSGTSWVLGQSSAGRIQLHWLSHLHRWHSGKECARQCRRCRRLRFDPGLGRSLGRGNGNPLQHSCLENPMDRGAWQATVPEVAKSQIWLFELTHACIDTEDETFLVDGALGWGRRAAEGKKGPYIFHPLRSDAPTTHPFEFNPFKELGSSVLSPLASQFLSSLSSVPLLPTRVLGLLNQ